MKWLIVVFSILFLISYIAITNTPQKPYTPPSTSYVEFQAKKPVKKEVIEKAPLDIAILGALTLKKSARDPDSFRLSQVLIMDSGAACYTYRAQNGFGGMNIEHAVINASGTDIKSETSTGFRKLWNKLCNGKTGTDKTKDIEWYTNYYTNKENERL